MNSTFLNNRIALSKQIKENCSVGKYADCGIRYEGEFTDTFAKEIKNARVYVDCGGELGFYSHIAASLMAQNTQIHVFEPQPVNFEVLSNMFTTDSRVSLYNAAVSNERGGVILASIADSESDLECVSTSFTMDTSLSMLKNMNKFEEGRRVELTVPGVALDDIFVDTDVDIIKMDIEGGEVLAFEGMQKLLARRCAVIYIEMHYDYIRAIRSDGIEYINEMLKKNRYDCCDMRDGKQVEKITAGRYILRPRQ